MLEKNFEKNISRVASLMGCKYFKIPDTHMITKNNRRYHREEKRPFDAVLITPNKTFVIEAKIGYGALKPHQKINLETANAINANTGYVVRWFESKVRIELIEKSGKITTDFNDIKEMLNYFKSL